MNEHDYDIVAGYYDYLFADRTIDLNFWTTLAKQSEGTVLEFSCGTGRITFDMASAGVSVDGMDISQAMLDISNKRLKKLDTRVAKRIRFIHGDSTDFSIPGKKYSAIFSPWGFVPLSDAQEDSCFNCVIDHLQDNGIFVIDIDNMSETDVSWSRYRLKEYKKIPGKEFTLMREGFNSGDVKRRETTTLFRLSKISDNGNIKQYCYQIRYRTYTRQQLESVLLGFGFEIDSVYGDYNFSRWTSESPRTIIVARYTKNMTLRKAYQRLCSWLK